MSEASYNDCKMDIDEFADSVKDAPQQKTPDWYDQRRNTMGGSEVAILIDANHPYKGLAGLIKEKIGLSKFFGNIHTRWGNILERITKEWTERVLCMVSPIIEIGSVEGPIPRQRYSPDGIGIVKLKSHRNTTDISDEKEEQIENDEYYDYYKVLFEFKAPSRTIPNGIVPSHYLPQVQTGLMNIPTVDLAIFVNNCYRKCSLFDLSFDPGYDTTFHDGDIKKKAAFLTKKQPLACGIICFYQTDKQYNAVLQALGYDDSIYESDNDVSITDILTHDNPQSYENVVYQDTDADLLMNSCYANIYDIEYIKGLDFGIEQSETIERLFELYDAHHVQAFYMPMFINGEQVKSLPMLQTHNLYQDADITTNDDISDSMHNQFEHYYNTCQEQKWKPIGYLPWKLLLSDIIPILRDEDWQKKVEPFITQALNTLDNILQSDNVEDAYYTHFPNKTDLTQEDLDISSFMKT